VKMTSSSFVAKRYKGDFKRRTTLVPNRGGAGRAIMYMHGNQKFIRHDSKICYDILRNTVLGFHVRGLGMELKERNPHQGFHSLFCAVSSNLCLPVLYLATISALGFTSVPSNQKFHAF
jgi:hypothetical protein